MLLNTIIVRSYLAADVTRNNTAAMADTALSVDVAASKKYAVEFVGHVTSVAKAMMFDFGGTATITNFIGQWDARGAANFTLGTTARVTAVGTDFGDAVLDATDAIYIFRGSVEINAAGTFLVRAAQVAANATDTTLKRGSRLILTKFP